MNGCAGGARSYKSRSQSLRLNLPCWNSNPLAPLRFSKCSAGRSDPGPPVSSRMGAVQGRLQARAVGQIRVLTSRPTPGAVISRLRIDAGAVVRSQICGYNRARAWISRRTLSENRTSIFCGSMTAVTSPKPKVGCVIVCPLRYVRVQS